MGILTLLVVFGISFVTLTNIERTASRNYIDGVQARMIARAGLERAVAELRRHAETKAFDDSRPQPAGDPWIFRDRYATTPVGLRTTAQISYPVQAPTDSGGVYRFRTEANDGTTLPLFVSGVMGQSYTNGLDCYKLKILDCSSMIYVNSPDGAALQRMVKNLLRSHFGGLSNADADAIALRVRNRRPGGGYRTKEELGLVMREATSGPNLTEAQWNRVRDDLTCFAWTDTKVIAPPLAAAGTTNVNQDIDANLALSERAPVNMNTASVHVLTAALAELQARYVTRTRTIAFGANPNFNFTTTSVNINFNTARTIAQAIIARRDPGGSATGFTGPFRSWYEFETWLDQTRPGGVNGRQRDLIKAMANPNTAIVLRKWGLEGNNIFRWVFQGTGGSNGAYLPDVPREIDKSDLSQITTEMCFSSMGYFEITSLGQVWESGDRNGNDITVSRPIAEQTIQSIVQVFEVLRLTSQADFEKDRDFQDPKMFLTFTKAPTTVKGFNPDLDIPGAWPATLTQPEFSNHHVLPTAGNTGAALSNGNERYTLSESFRNPATYDGSIILNALARIEATEQDCLIGFARGSLDALKARHAQTDRGRGGSNDPIYGARTEPAICTTTGASRLRIANAAGARSLLSPGDDFQSLFRGSALTNLGPLITEDRGQYLSYDGNNIDLREGTCHFWVKPVSDVATPGKQVYVSWLGGFRDNGSRDAGFEIYKEVDDILNIVKIVVTFYGLSSTGRGHAASPLEFIVGRTETREGQLTTRADSLWKEGAWNHVQFSFGIDLQSGGPSYDGTLIVNSQYMLDGYKELSEFDRNGPDGVRHAYQFNGTNADGDFFVDAATSVGSRGKQWRIPYLPFDYYFCQFDTTSTAKVYITDQTPFAIIEPSEDGQYRPRTFPTPVSFPAGSADQELIVEFQPSALTPEPVPTPPTPETALGPQQHDSSNYPVNSEQQPSASDYYYNPPTSVRNNRWKLAYFRRWSEQRPSPTPGTCRYCRSRTFCSVPPPGKAPFQADPDIVRAQGYNSVDARRYHCFSRFWSNLGTEGKFLVNECDDCEGCEDCDVDAPILIGAELVYPSNYGSEAIVPPASFSQRITDSGDPWLVRNTNSTSTSRVFHFAQAVMDNIYFLGYRVDEHGRTGGTGVTAIPSERFFDSDVRELNSTQPNATGHKPGYKRLLTELYGRRYRLCTITWTSYPGYDRLPIGEAAKVRSAELAALGVNANSQIANESNNRGNLRPQSLLPITMGALKWDFSLPGSSAIDYVNPPSNQGGANFTTGIANSRTGAPDPLTRPQDPDRGGQGIFPTQDVDRDFEPQQLLILDVGFAPQRTSVPGTYQTPLLDDITVTYVTTPKIIYTEEGVDE